MFSCGFPLEINDRAGSFLLALGSLSADRAIGSSLWLPSAHQNEEATCIAQSAADITDCSLRQGARPFKGTYKGDCLKYFSNMFGKSLICLVSKTCFLSFSTQNHAESFGNYDKKSFVDKAILFLYFYVFLDVFEIFQVFGLKTMLFELLHAKPCRFIWKLP